MNFFANIVCMKFHKHKLGGTALMFMRPDMFDISGHFFILFKISENILKGKKKNEFLQRIA